MSDEEKSITVKIPKFALKDDHHWIEQKLAHLIIENVIFVNNGWWFEKEGKSWPKDFITVHVNCNDVFGWGCADGEDITHGEVNELYSMWVKDPIWGPAAWCIKKRNMMPQEPVKEAMEKAGWNVKGLVNETK